jgi:hypothetical protein
VGKGRIKPNISRIGVSFPSIEMTKAPFLGFSSLIFTENECSVLASRAAVTTRALFLNAFQDLQCSIEIVTVSTSLLDFLVATFFAVVFLILFLVAGVAAIVA